MGLNKESVPTTTKGRRTRERIYSASIALIQKKGYEAVTVPEICSAGGVSVGSFYHHFSSKKALLAGYVREESDRLLGFYHGLQGYSPLEALSLTLHEFFGYFSVKGQDFVGSFLSIVLSSRGRFFHPYDFSLYQIIGECLREAVGAGELTDRLPIEVLSDLLTGSIWQLMVEWCTSESRGDLQKMADGRFSQLRSLLEGAPSTTERTHHFKKNSNR